MAARFKRKQHFAEYYAHLCALKGLCPLAVSRACRAKMTSKTLEIRVDRLQYEDWQPLLAALPHDRHLQVLRFKSRWFAAQRQSRSGPHPRRSTHVGLPPHLRQQPVIHYHVAAADLCRALASLLAHSEHLHVLEISGIPLQKSHLLLLCEIASLMTTALKHTVVSAMLQSSNSITAADLSHNCCSERGCRSLARVIQAQNAKRGADTWAETLRARPITRSGLAGLRVLNMDHNTRIGDTGTAELAHALADDTWLLELSLRDCAITSTSYDSFVEALRFNARLVRLKLANNPMPRALQTRVQNMLALNQSDADWAANQSLQDTLSTLEVDLQLVKEMAALKPTPRKLRTRPSSAPASATRRRRKRTPHADTAPTTDELLQELEFQVDSMAACSLDEMEPLDESDEKIEQIEAGLEKLNELLAQLAHVAQA